MVDEPTTSLASTGLGYVFHLTDPIDGPLVTVEVANLRQRNGSLYGLLTTSSTISGARRLPGSDRVLSSEVWLLSERGRGEYAKRLTDLIPAPPGTTPINFDTLLEDLVQQVIEQENAPVTVTRLTPQMAASGTPFIIPGIVPVGRSTILYGAGGTGKSLLACSLAVCAQIGAPFLGMETKQTEVLYLDWETDEADIAGRVAAVSAGMGVDMPDLRYASLVRPIEDRVNQLARYVSEEGVGLVIVDSVGMAMNAARDGADASEGAIRFFRALRSLTAAVVAIDHVSGEDMKRGRSGSPKPYGSVYKWNSARNAFELRIDRDPDEAGSHLILKHRKSNIGPYMEDAHLTLDWKNGSARFMREEADAHPDLGPLSDRILDILAGGSAGARGLSDLLSEQSGDYVSEFEVRMAVKGLVMDGKVEVGGSGAIQLAEEAIPDLVPDEPEMLPS